MKKTYFKPEVELVDIMINNAILALSIPESEGDGKQEGDFGSNKHRGEWGNVWGN